MSKPKAKVFIDGANVFYTQKMLGYLIDLKSLIKIFQKDYDLTGVKYYTGLKDGDAKMSSFLRYLDKNNIQPVTKPLKKIKDGGKVIFKSNFDVEMTMDILLERDSYDVCILVSGDSDFHALVKKLKDFGKEVVVCSSRRMISWELKLTANRHLFLEDLDIKNLRPLGRSNINSVTISKNKSRVKTLRIKGDLPALHSFSEGGQK